MSIAKRLKSGLINSAGRVVAVLIIVMSLYIAAGRQLVTLVEDYTPAIEDILSSALNLDLEIGNLKGTWEGFGPKLTIQGLRLGQELEVGTVEITPSLLSSFIQGRLVASHIEFSDIRVIVTKNSPDGGWNLADLVVKPLESNAENPPANTEAVSVKQVFETLQPLLVQDKLELTNVAVIVALEDTEPLILQVEHALLNSVFDTKKLSFSGWIFSGQQTADVTMVAELDQWQDAPVGRVYLSQQYFDWSNWVQFLPGTLGLSQLSTDMEVWLTLEGGKVTTVRSRLDIPELELSQDQRKLALQDVHAEVTLELGELETMAWLNDVQFQFQDMQWKNSLHQIYWGQNGFELMSNRLDVGLLSALGKVFTDNPALEGLSPTGRLLNSRVVWKADAAPYEQLIIQGRFEDAEVLPWMGIPGLKGLGGYIDMTPSQGYVQIVPSEAWLDLPKVFGEPVFLTKTQGGIGWTWSPTRGLTLVSDQLVTEIPGVENLTLAFSVFAPPATDWEFREPRFDFHLAFDKADRRILDTFLPVAIDRESRGWIEDSIGQADISHGILTLSLPTVKKEKIASTVLLDLDIDNGRVSFLPEWPDITDLKAHLTLDNDHINLDIPTATYQEYSLYDGQVSVDLKPNTEVIVDFNAVGNSGAGVAFLTASPLRTKIGSALDQWVVPSGTAEAQVSLQIPLNGAPVKGSTQVVISNTDLVLPEYEMAIADINGTLNWSDQTGVVANDLVGNFFGHATQFNVSSVGEDLAETRIAIDGTANIADLGLWLDDAILQGFTQSAGYQAELLIGAQEVAISVDTNLVGVDFPYPYPLNKDAEELWPLSLSVVIDDMTTTIKSRLDNRFSAAFLLQDGVIQKGQLTTDPQPVLPVEDGVFVKLALDTVDGDLWQIQIDDWFGLYDRYVPLAPSDGPRLDTLIREVVVEASEITFFEESWSRAAVYSSRTDEGWIATYKATEVQGTFGWGHEAEAAMLVDIDFVSLKTAEEGDASQTSDPLGDYDPRTIPTAIVQVKRLILNDRDLGGWSAMVTPVDNGVLISKIGGQVTGIAVNGDVEWLFDGIDHHTHLIANATVKDLGDVLVAWKQTRDIGTESGSVNMDLQWPASPLGVKAKSLNGDLILKFTNGALLNVGQEYESLKLLSIINPALIMRRLSFDFRDIVRNGIGFDSITGKISFLGGKLLVEEPIVVDGTASIVKVGGEYDFNKDLMDFEMVFTVPISNALPLAALIAGLSPQVALAVFVTERILNNDLAKFSSAKYQISGSAKAPQFRLSKAFDNSLAPPKKE